ncbi:DUF6986 family protein [Actinokineospora guangxiensis]|uniref:DUF6986 family protein n=1 Tax=Actinokineospora guangxiensis TaxID=1490288 RepID=A0ABW0EWM8_9PSEU
MRTTLDGALLTTIAAQLSPAEDEPTATGRQPVHTCYVPADRVDADLPARWGEAALAALAEHAPTPAALAAVVGLPPDLAPTVYERVTAKLAAEPVEDLRIDFEDGYGVRDNQTEDDHACAAADLLAGWGLASAGLRVKSFDTTASLLRSVRTLDLVLTHLGDPQRPTSAGLSQPPPDNLAAGGRTLTPGFTVTFPKVTDRAQVSAFAEVLDVLEERLDLRPGVLRFEIQIETPRSVVAADGRLAVPGLITAGRGRVSGLHFGTYDYTAALGLSAADQHLAHAACDFARHVMQVGAAGTGVRLSDGSSNVLPTGDPAAVRHGWQTHYRLVRRSLRHGFFQGWDLHPAQLVTRYAAVFTHHMENADADAHRLAAYLDSASGSVQDEPATAAALAGSLLRAVDCGALSADEVADRCGLSPAELTALTERRGLVRR